MKRTVTGPPPEDDDNADPAPKRGRAPGATDAAKPDPWEFARATLPSRNDLPPPLVPAPGTRWDWPPVRGYDTAQWYPYKGAPPFDPADAELDGMVEDGQTQMDFFGPESDVEPWRGEAVCTGDAEDSYDDTDVTNIMTADPMVPDDAFALTYQEMQPGTSDLTMPFAGVAWKYRSACADGRFTAVRPSTPDPDDGRMLHLFMRMNKIDLVVDWVQSAIHNGWHDSLWKRALFNGLAYPHAPQFVRDRVANMMADPRTRAWMLSPAFWPLNLRRLHWTRHPRADADTGLPVTGPAGVVHPRPPATAPTMQTLRNPAFAARVDILTACTLCNVPGSAALLAEILRGLRAQPPPGVVYGPNLKDFALGNNPLALIEAGAPRLLNASMTRALDTARCEQLFADMVVAGDPGCAWPPPPLLGDGDRAHGATGKFLLNSIGRVAHIWNVWDRMFALTPKILAGVAYDWAPAHLLYTYLYDGHTLPGQFPLAAAAPPVPAAPAGRVPEGVPAAELHARLQDAAGEWLAARPYYGDPECVLKRRTGPIAAAGLELPGVVQTEQRRPITGYTDDARVGVPVTRPPVAPLQHTYPGMFTLLHAAGFMVDSAEDWPPGFVAARARVTAAVPMNESVISPHVTSGRALLRLWFDGDAYRRVGNKSRTWGTPVLSIMAGRYHPAIAERMSAFFSGGAVRPFYPVTAAWKTDVPDLRTRGWFVDAFLCAAGVYVAPMEDRIHALSAASTRFPRLLPCRPGGQPFQQQPAFLALFGMAAHRPPPMVFAGQLRLGTSRPGGPGLTPDNAPVPPGHPPAMFWYPGNPADGNAAHMDARTYQPQYVRGIGKFVRGMGRASTPGEVTSPAAALVHDMRGVAEAGATRLNGDAIAIRAAHAEAQLLLHRLRELTERENGVHWAWNDARALAIASGEKCKQTIDAAPAGSLDVTLVEGVNELCADVATMSSLTASVLHTHIAALDVHARHLIDMATDGGAAGATLALARQASAFVADTKECRDRLVVLSGLVEQRQAVLAEYELKMNGDVLPRVTKYHADVEGLEAQMQELWVQRQAAAAAEDAAAAATVQA